MIVSNVLVFLNVEARLPKSCKVAVMVNNLGVLSLLELNGVAEEVIRQLNFTNLDIRRTLVGIFVTSLDGPGFSVTILVLEDRMEDLLNAQINIPTWSNLISNSRAEEVKTGLNDIETSEKPSIKNVTANV